MLEMFRKLIKRRGQRDYTQEQILTAYKAVFNSAAGDIVLQDLLVHSSDNLTTTFVSGDSHASAYQEGRRSLFRYILKALEADTRHENKTQGEDR